MKKNVMLIFTIFFISSSISIAQENMLTFGLEKTPPYVFQEGEQVKGILVDLVQASLKDSGYLLKMRILPPKRSAHWCEDGIIDGIVGVAKDVPLFEGAIFSKKIIKISIHAIVHKETKISFKTIDDLKPYKIGVVAGIGFEKIYPTLKFDTVTLTEQNIKKLFHKRIDILFEDPVIVNYIVKNYFTQNQYQILNPSLMEVDLAISFSSKTPGYKHKVTSFNKGLALIKRNGVYDEILKNWANKTNAAGANNRGAPRSVK